MIAQRRSLLAVSFALAVVVVGVTGCGGRSRAVPPTAAHDSSQQSAAKTSLEDIVGTNVSGRDRAILMLMAKQLPASVRARATHANTTLTVAVMDSQGRIARQFANRPGLSLAAKRNTAATAPSGVAGARTVSTGAAAGSARRAPSDASALPGLGAGPYHTVVSESGLGSGNWAGVNAPCSATVNPGDIPYVAIGGSTDQPNSQIEFGAQFIVDPDPAKNAYVPYFRYSGGSGLVPYPGNAVTLAYAGSGTGDGTTFACGSNQSLQLELSLVTQTAVPSPYDPLAYETLFTSILSSDSGAVVMGLINPAANWQGWIGLPPPGTNACTHCYYYTTTSIALASPSNAGGGDAYGPAQWSGMNIEYDFGGTSAVAYSKCINFPAWTTGGNECGNTPANPLSSVIQVSGQSLGAVGAETVTINDAPPGLALLTERLQTTQYPSDAPSYTFADSTAAGGPDVSGSGSTPSSAARSRRDLLHRVACNGSIAVNVQANGLTPNTVPATWDLFCPVDFRFPAASVGDIHVITHVYAFNQQGSELEQPQDHKSTCNYFICTGSLQIPIPADSKIVVFETYYTGRGEGVVPESIHDHYRVPFNSRGFAYPEIVDTRYSRPPLPPKLALVPFPPGAPTREITKCPKARNTAGCMDPVAHYKEKIERAYRNAAIYPNSDLSYVDVGNIVDAHHIQELEWAGDNSVQNGVLLLKDDHLLFSAWWRQVRGY